MHSEDGLGMPVANDESGRDRRLEWEPFGAAVLLGLLWIGAAVWSVASGNPTEDPWVRWADLSVRCAVGLMWCYGGVRMLYPVGPDHSVMRWS